MSRLLLNRFLPLKKSILNNSVTSQRFFVTKFSLFLASVASHFENPNAHEVCRVSAEVDIVDIFAIATCVIRVIKTRDYHGMRS